MPQTTLCYFKSPVFETQCLLEHRPRNRGVYSGPVIYYKFYGTYATFSCYCISLLIEAVLHSLFHCDYGLYALLI